MCSGMNASGGITRCLVPSTPRRHYLELHLPGGVALHPFVRQRQAGDLDLNKSTEAAATAFPADAR